MSLSLKENILGPDLITLGLLEEHNALVRDFLQAMGDRDEQLRVVADHVALRKSQWGPGYDSEIARAAVLEAMAAY